MIEANNQKLAAEQLKPEFERIDTTLMKTTDLLKVQKTQIAVLQSSLNEQIAALESSLTVEIAALQTAMIDEKKLAASKNQQTRLALNKAEEDIGLIQEKINEIQGICAMHQNDIKAMRSAVDSQKDVMLNVFRKQQEELEGMIAALETTENAQTNDVSVELIAPTPGQ